MGCGVKRTAWRHEKLPGWFGNPKLTGVPAQPTNLVDVPKSEQKKPLSQFRATVIYSHLPSTDWPRRRPERYASNPANLCSVPAAPLPHSSPWCRNPPDPWGRSLKIPHDHHHPTCSTGWWENQPENHGLYPHRTEVVGENRVKVKSNFWPSPLCKNVIIPIPLWPGASRKTSLVRQWATKVQRTNETFTIMVSW